MRPALRKARASVIEILDASSRRVAFGVVVGKGEVLTSAHTSLRGKGMSVRDRDGRHHELEILGIDGNEHLTLLSVPTLPELPQVVFFAPHSASTPKGAPPARNAARRGGLVLSVGSGSRAVAAGMISAVDRTITGQERFEPVPIRGVSSQGRGPVRTPVQFHPHVIQHDSLLQLNELGSILLAGDGTVLGLNVSNVLHGISYAVPADRVARSLPALRQGRSVAGKPRGFLGVRTRPAPVWLLRSLEVPGAVIVEEVLPGQAAKRAGLQAGDVLISMDGQAILDFSDLVQWISACEPGQTVRLELARSGRIIDVPVKIGSTEWD